MRWRIGGIQWQRPHDSESADNFGDISADIIIGHDMIDNDNIACYQHCNY
ncbi:hypothetical protein [Bifidobacterium subtile]|jgi:hypothetical protein